MGGGADYVVLAVGGLGFRVFVPPSRAAGLEEAASVKLYLHMSVREDSISLYGFSSERELAAFRLLITVSGIGPKLALAVLSSWEVEELAQILATSNAKALTTVSGIGPKTAQRICLELKDKLAPTAQDSAVDLLASAEAALVGLGFRALEVRPVLRSLARDSKDIEELVRRALSRLTGGGN